MSVIVMHPIDAVLERQKKQMRRRGWESSEHREDAALLSVCPTEK
jgi:hypothetical protein